MLYHYVMRSTKFGPSGGCLHWHMRGATDEQTVRTGTCAVLRLLRKRNMQVNLAAWHPRVVAGSLLEAPAVLWVVGRVGGKGDVWKLLYLNEAPPTATSVEVSRTAVGSCGPGWLNFGKLEAFPTLYQFQEDRMGLETNCFPKLPELKQKACQVQHRAVTKLHVYMGAVSRRMAESSEGWRAERAAFFTGRGGGGRGSAQAQSSSSSGSKGRGGGESHGKGKGKGKGKKKGKGKGSGGAGRGRR